MIDLNKYSKQELIDLKSQIENHLQNMKDGYLYICKIRSYGSNYNLNYDNDYSAKECFYEYNGDNGYCDLYTNNPEEIRPSYGGSVYYVKSQEDFDKWLKYEKMSSDLEYIKRELNENPKIKCFSEEDLLEAQKDFDEIVIDFEEPVPFTDELRTKLLRELKIERILK
jgi:hypothetical protein